MDFDVFFSKKDKQDAVNAAKAMVFLPENCYFVEDPPPEIYFFLNDKKEIMAKIIVSYKNQWLLQLPLYRWFQWFHNDF